MAVVCWLMFARVCFLFSISTDTGSRAEESYKQNIVVEGNKVSLEILDTAGQAEFHAFRNVAMGYADGFVVVYSIVDAKSFEDAKALVHEVKEVHKKPILVVGNKTDLADDRTVSKKDATDFCNSVGVQYSECSAKTETLVPQFQQIVSFVLRQQVVVQKPASCCCIS
eukprot:m.9191 g.9191  ORF g.9191 m.9191 type:complete len:168 (-) comp2375_c0_seq1:54-557(-)